MSIVTRCPACGTAFKVQPAQLSARGGKVRCGRCGTVFEGAACMVEPEFATRTVDIPLEPDAAIGDAPAEVPEFMAEEGARRPLTLLWSFVSLLAFLALAGQVVYRYRTDIATAVPELRPYLGVACSMIDCEVPLPRRSQLLSIESSDLQADPRREKVLHLSAVLHNRAPFAQQPPLLELTLTDEHDRAVLRRVLYPHDYLGVERAERVATEGIAAGTEVNVSLDFDASQVHATGYRLYLFYQ